jgi:ribonuclease HII
MPVGLDDSKKLGERRREALEVEIKASALAWGVGFASVEEIAELNILQATGLAMRRAVEALEVVPAFILVDGSYRFDLPSPVRPVVRGDSLSASIAAASILAKTARDRVMVELDQAWPDYGFAAHKGYHAPVHVEALQRLGPCPAHRLSWAPIRALLNSTG